MKTIKNYSVLLFAFVALAFIACNSTSPMGEKVKDGMGIAINGLEAVAQGIYDCSDMFPPLKTVAGIFLTIKKTINVRALQLCLSSGIGFHT